MYKKKFILCFLLLLAGIIVFLIYFRPADIVKKNFGENQLKNATSPYLRQHADNPINWNFWNEETLEHARKNNKIIFLSIGYSTCYWCHVMEEESFSKENIAEFFNQHFVNIKIDREERPDLDEIYMTATNIITGSGGWPNSVFLTPEQVPFFAGTYFSNKDLLDIGEKIVSVATEQPNFIPNN